MSVDPIKPLSRNQAVPLLVQRFASDYQDALKHYDLPQRLELTEHLQFTVDLIFLYAKTDNADIYHYYLELEDELLTKYRKAYKPYFVKQFFTYFWFDTVLLDKGIYTEEEYNRLTLEQRRLTVEEIVDFVNRCRDILHYGRAIIYLQMEPEGAIQKAETIVLPQEEPDKEATKARQLLAIYYLLKAGFDIEHRSTHPVSDVVRLAHLLTGTKLTNMQNSDIYKKYSLMPNYKKDEQLIADLRFIRPYFEQLHIEKGVKLIDEEIQRAIRELPVGVRKKYRKDEQ
jgi:hypothetical protein